MCVFFPQALRWGLAGAARPGMWTDGLLLPPGQGSPFPEPGPKPWAPLEVLSRHRREPSGSAGEGTVSTPLRPRILHTETHPGGAECSPLPWRSSPWAPGNPRDPHNGPCPLDKENSCGLRLYERRMHPLGSFPTSGSPPPPGRHYQMPRSLDGSVLSIKAPWTRGNQTQRRRPRVSVAKRRRKPVRSCPRMPCL